MARAALAWYDAMPMGLAPVIFSSVPPAVLVEVQKAGGVEGASRLLETATGLVARGLVNRG